MSNDFKEPDPALAHARAPRTTCQHHPNEGVVCPPCSHVVPAAAHGFFPNFPYNNFGAQFPFGPMYQPPFQPNWQGGPPPPGPCAHGGSWGEAPQVIPSGPRNNNGFSTNNNNVPLPIIPPPPMYYGYGWPYISPYPPPAPGQFESSSHPVVVEGLEERKGRSSVRIARNACRCGVKVETITLLDSDEESESTDSSMVAEETPPKSPGTSSVVLTGGVVPGSGGGLPRVEKPEHQASGSACPGQSKSKAPKSTNEVVENGLNSVPEVPLAPPKESTTKVSTEKKQDKIPVLRQRRTEDGSNDGPHSGSSSPSPPVLFPEAPTASAPGTAKPSAESAKVCKEEKSDKETTRSQSSTQTPKKAVRFSNEVTVHNIPRRQPLDFASRPTVKGAVRSSTKARSSRSTTKARAEASSSKSQVLNTKLPADNNNKKRPLKRPAESQEARDGRHSPDGLTRPAGKAKSSLGPPSKKASTASNAFSVPYRKMRAPPKPQTVVRSDAEVTSRTVVDYIEESPITSQQASDAYSVSHVKRRRTFSTGRIRGIAWTTPKSAHQPQKVTNSSASPKKPSTSGTQPQHSK